MADLLQHACTFLFVPATQPARLGKALASGADMVIADWEDAVAPGDKDAARAALEQAVQALPPADRARLLVRINAQGSAWFGADLQALARLAAAGVAGAMVPKAEGAGVLRQAADAAGGGCALVPLIESVAGIDALDAIAAAPQVARLAFGHLDFQVDAGMQCAQDEGELLPTRMALVMASRRAGLAQPVDGVTVDTRDAARTEADTRRAQRMGFGAKLCIHPAQVPLVNGVFAPSAEAVAHAQAVVQAMQAAQGGVCVVGGKMVDAPVLRLAERTLARHAWACQRTSKIIAASA
ncbi:CoA ester lyase [Acidovorax sp. MR-S7]|uniref:HpcH/HpaI aldolase/citrate lyase family protein n=1 Tax=Acidovorax sp. MR-S7 TaxID=1268622 RepID=UPI0003790D53|nr:CoA ester lyase [Acidovorax sp. MR-S7]GAD20586.1 citrate lyase beta subunit [Acidovorax sp. MR-S7]